MKQKVTYFKDEARLLANTACETLELALGGLFAGREASWTATAVLWEPIIAGFFAWTSSPLGVLRGVLGLPDLAECGFTTDF